jgi:hypothetical protein
MRRGGKTAREASTVEVRHEPTGSTVRLPASTCFRAFLSGAMWGCPDAQATKVQADARSSLLAFARLVRFKYPDATARLQSRGTLRPKRHDMLCRSSVFSCARFVDSCQVVAVLPQSPVQFCTTGAIPLSLYSLHTESHERI